MEKARDHQRELFMCFIDYKKAFDCVDHQILWYTLKDMRVPEHLIVVLRNIYTNQESTVRTEYGEKKTTYRLVKEYGKDASISIDIQYLRRKNNARCPVKVG